MAGSHNCSCISGYQFELAENGVQQCFDINECQAAENPCQVGGNQADCQNSDGGFSCFCKEGFTGTVGISEINECTDINECANDPCSINTGNQAECQNNIGSFECICLNGYTMTASGSCQVRD